MTLSITTCNSVCVLCYLCPTFDLSSLLSHFSNSHLSFESRSCWDLNYEDEKYKGDGCYKGRHCHHEHCFDEVCNLPSPANLPFYTMLTSRWVGSVMFAFEEVVHWLQTAAGDHLHLRLPKLQRLELERNGDHRCAGHRRQWGALLQGAVHLLLRQDKTRQDKLGPSP